MIDIEKIIAAHTALKNIIENNAGYFADKDASDVADDFINAYTEDKKLPYKRTPNIEVDNAVTEALQLTGF